MTTNITLSDVSSKLPALLEAIRKGDEIVVTDRDKIVARVIGEGSILRTPREFGFLKGKIEIIAEDEEHLKDFEEYMK